MNARPHLQSGGHAGGGTAPGFGFWTGRASGVDAVDRYEHPSSGGAAPPLDGHQGLRFEHGCRLTNSRMFTLRPPCLVWTALTLGGACACDAARPLPTEVERSDAVSETMDSSVRAEPTTATGSSGVNGSLVTTSTGGVELITVESVEARSGEGPTSSNADVEYPTVLDSSVSTFLDSASSSRSMDGGTADGCSGPAAHHPFTLGTCEATPPPDCTVTDFGETFACEFTGMHTCWGYGDIYEYADVASDVTWEHSGHSLNVSGTSATHAGVALSFGPCIDASHWGGVQVTWSGELDGCSLFVLLLTEETFPREAERGACEFTSEASKWDECVPARFEIPRDSGGVVTVPWREFKAGVPVDSPDPRQLRGMRFEVVAPLGESCDFAIEIDDLRWSREEG